MFGAVVIGERLATLSLYRTHATTLVISPFEFQLTIGHSSEVRIEPGFFSRDIRA